MPEIKPVMPTSVQKVSVPHLPLAAPSTAVRSHPALGRISDSAGLTLIFLSLSFHTSLFKPSFRHIPFSSDILFSTTIQKLRFDPQFSSLWTQPPLSSMARSARLLWPRQLVLGALMVRGDEGNKEHWGKWILLPTAPSQPRTYFPNSSPQQPKI